MQPEHYTLNTMVKMMGEIRYIKKEYEAKEIQYPLLQDGITLFARNLIGTYKRNIGRLDENVLENIVNQFKDDLYEAADIIPEWDQTS